MSQWPTPSIITLVEQQKRRSRRYNIYLNDDYAFSIHEDVLVKHRLFKGEEVHADHLQQILKDEEQQKVFSQALRFITRKPRAMKEIEKKLLEKGYELEIINTVLQKLIQQKYINDQEFAATLTNYRIRSQKKGRRWVKQELIQKGLSKDHVEQAMAQIDSDTEYNFAYEIAKKRWDRQNGEDMEKRRKVGGFLLRRGYTNETVNRVLRKLQGNDMEDEYDLN